MGLPVRRALPCETLTLLAARLAADHDDDMDRGRTQRTSGAHDAPRDADRLLRVGEVAAVLGISVRQVWKLCRFGELPDPIRIGGSTRWRESEIQGRIRSDDEECG